MRAQADPPVEHVSAPAVSPKRPSLVPLGLAIALCGAVLVFCLLTAVIHPDIEASLESRVPAAGVPLTLSGLDGDRRPSLETTLGSFAVTELPSKPLPGGSGGRGRLQLSIPVAGVDCAGLRQVLGGGCGGSPGGPVAVDSLEVESVPAGWPLALQLRMRGAAALELTQSTASTQQPIPTAWSLREDAATTTAGFWCSQPVRLRIAAPPLQRTVTCAPGGAVFELSLALDRSHPPALFLNGVQRLETEAAGEEAKLGVSRGLLSVGGDQERLQGAEVRRVAIRGGGGEAVEMGLEDAAGSGVARVAASAGRASAVRVDGEDRVPSWLDRHSELEYLLIGLAVGVLLTALLDYLLKARRAEVR